MSKHLTNSERKIKALMEEHEFSFNAEHWAKMDAVLQEKRRKPVFWLWWAIGVVSILTLSWVGYTQFPHTFKQVSSASKVKIAKTNSGQSPQQISLEEDKDSSNRIRTESLLPSTNKATKTIAATNNVNQTSIEQSQLKFKPKTNSTYLPKQKQTKDVSSPVDQKEQPTKGLDSTNEESTIETQKKEQSDSEPIASVNRVDSKPSASLEFLPTLNSLPKQVKEEEHLDFEIPLRKYHPFKFGLIGGLVGRANLQKNALGLVSLSKNSAIDSVFSVDPLGGLFLKYSKGGKFSFQAELLYKSWSKVDVSSSSTDISISLQWDPAIFLSGGYTTTTVSEVKRNTTKKLYFLELPLIASYNISPKHKIQGGVGLSWLFNSEGQRSTFNATSQEVRDAGSLTPTVSVQSINSVAKTSENKLLKWSASGLLGYEYQLNKHLALNLRYNIGITNLIKNSENETFGVRSLRNTDLQFSIRYQF